MKLYEKQKMKVGGVNIVKAEEVIPTPSVVRRRFCSLLFGLETKITVLRHSNGSKERLTIVTPPKNPDGGKFFDEQPITPDYVLGLLALTYMPNTEPDPIATDAERAAVLAAVELYSLHCKRIGSYKKKETANAEYTLVMEEVKEKDTDFSEKLLTD